MITQKGYNRFSIEDISILKQDTVNTAALSNILGGFLERSCKCKCDSGNCFKDKEKPIKKDIE